MPNWLGILNTDATDCGLSLHKPDVNALFHNEEEVYFHYPVSCSKRPALDNITFQQIMQNHDSKCCFTWGFTVDLTIISGTSCSAHMNNLLLTLSVMLQSEAWNSAHHYECGRNYVWKLFLITCITLGFKLLCWVCWGMSAPWWSLIDCSSQCLKKNVNSPVLPSCVYTMCEHNFRLTYSGYS